MKKVVLVTAISTLFLSLSLVDAPFAAACSCIEPSSVGESLNDAQAVFVGEVDSVEGSGDFHAVTFSVSQFWKGEIGQMVQVSTSQYSSMCGFDFQVGQEYLVYAHGEKDNLQVGICGRTAFILSAGEDLAALGEGTIITEETDANIPDEPPVVESIFLVILAVGLLLYRQDEF